jgi:hypothetical protein
MRALLVPSVRTTARYLFYGVNVGCAFYFFDLFVEHSHNRYTGKAYGTKWASRFEQKETMRRVLDKDTIYPRCRICGVPLAFRSNKITLCGICGQNQQFEDSIIVPYMIAFDQWWPEYLWEK